MNNNRIIYYYQTFHGLDDILYINTPVTHIHLSSIHFGNNKDNSPYIHLNDYEPNNIIFKHVWEQLQAAVNMGLKIILMVGGAGGAFYDLFKSFDIYYPLLKKTIEKYPVITGIDLDIEELVDIKNVKMLISLIRKDFGKDFTISMAPIQSSLQYDKLGLGGFLYKELLNSDEGKMIDYFNVQFYYDYSFAAFKQIIDNGYPEDIIVVGSISSQSMDSYKEELVKIKNTYQNVGGVFNWEYFDAPKNWHDIVDEILNNGKINIAYDKNNDISSYKANQSLYLNESNESLNNIEDSEDNEDNQDNLENFLNNPKEYDLNNPNNLNNLNNSNIDLENGNIDLSYLDTGDLILFNENRGIIPNIIKWYTNSIWTHVGIVLKNPTYISKKLKGYYLLESGFNEFKNVDGEYYYGVQIVDLKQKILSYDGKICHRKLTKKIEPDILNNTINNIFKTVKNKPYDLNIYDFLCLNMKLQKNVHYKNTLLDYLSNFFFNHRKTDRFICSSLVAYVYVELGLLPNNINWSECEPVTFSMDNKEEELINFLDEQIFIKS